MCDNLTGDAIAHCAFLQRELAADPDELAGCVLDGAQVVAVELGEPVVDDGALGPGPGLDLLEDAAHATVDLPRDGLPLSPFSPLLESVRPSPVTELTSPSASLSSSPCSVFVCVRTCCYPLGLRPCCRLRRRWSAARSCTCWMVAVSCAVNTAGLTCWSRRGSTSTATMSPLRSARTVAAPLGSTWRRSCCSVAAGGSSSRS